MKIINFLKETEWDDIFLFFAYLFLFAFLEFLSFCLIDASYLEKKLKRKLQKSQIKYMQKF